MADTADKTSLRAPVLVPLSHSELELACAIFRKLSVGEDPRILANTHGGRQVYVKLVRSREQARGQ